MNKKDAKYINSLNKSYDELKKQLSWLEKLLNGLKTLTADEFDYNHYVSKFDKSNHCGTVCCAFGWMPRFVPESGVEWSNTSIWMYNGSPTTTFSEISWGFIRFMFYGGYIINSDLGEIHEEFGKRLQTLASDELLLKTFGGELKSRSYNANLKQVTNRVEIVLNFHKSLMSNGFDFEKSLDELTLPE